MPRVVSKNLFNFSPLGSVAPATLAALGPHMAPPPEVAEQMGSLILSEDPESDTRLALLLRGFMDGVMTTLLDHPGYSDNTDHVEEMIAVPTSHHGEYDVPVYVHTPNSLVGEKNRPVVIYAHGGGG